MYATSAKFRRCPTWRGGTCLHGVGRAVQDGAVRDVQGDHEVQGFRHGQTSQQRIYGVRGKGCCSDVVNVLVFVVGVLFRDFLVVGLNVVGIGMYW